MPDAKPILADSSALIALGVIEPSYSELVFSEVGISTTYTCFKEIRNKSRNSSNHWTGQGADRIIEYIKEDTIDYPTRVTTPGAPTVGQFDAGEKSLQLAVKKHEEVSHVIIYDSNAWHILERDQEELQGTSHSFHLEPPNFPLYILERETSIDFTQSEFCNQTEIMINRREWDGSAQESLFWSYPIDCSD